ncbi:MAG: hypothetical protein QF785_00570 [Phycisphaeraceae bacterium]|nr:hypothetical protein [Phycisphaeraceae bacterium]
MPGHPPEQHPEQPPGHPRRFASSDAVPRAAAALPLRAAIVLIAIALIQHAAAAEPVELLVNGSIEAVGADGSPTGWSPSSLRGGQGAWTVDTQVKHDGDRALRIDRTSKPGSCHWASDSIELAIDQETEVAFSVWVKAEDATYITAVVEVQSDTERYFQYITPFIISGSGFFDWKHYSTSLTLKPGGRYARIFLRLPATGTVWFDDVRLTASHDIRAGSRDVAQSTSRPAPDASTPSDPNNLDFRNLIRNTRMAGHWAKGDLPPGWSIHNPADREAHAKVSWAQNDPRPGYYALQLQWLGGGRYVAVVPETVKSIAGNRPMKLVCYPRTHDGGRAMLIVECLNDAGQVIQEDRSAVIEDADDYVTLNLDFVTHPQTRGVRIYCANIGAGSVWFHWVTLEPDAGAVFDTATFPFAVSCEPAEGNRFWNNDQAVLHSFIDSPTSVSFMFWGDKTRLDNPRLILEVPQGITIPEAFNQELRAPVNHENAAFTTEACTRNNEPHVRYVFSDPAVLRRLRVSPYTHNGLTLCFEPNRFAKGSEHIFYYYLSNGAQVTAARPVTLKILPPLAKTPNPRRFDAHLWTVDDINFRDMQLVERIVHKYEEAGLAGRVRWHENHPQVIRIDRLLKERGWFLFDQGGDHAFHESLFPAIDGDGKPSSRWYCPSFVISDEAFYRDKIVPSLQRQITDIGIEDGEFIYLDYEPGSICTKVCFDERCRQLFAKRFDIPLDNIRTRRDILMNHSRQWGEFWAYLCDEIIRLHVKAVSEVNPTIGHAMYGYHLPFDNPQATANQLFNSPLDTRMNQKHMDRLLLSFYYTIGVEAIEAMDQNVRHLDKPVYMMPFMASTFPIWANNFPDDLLLSPAAMRTQVHAAAASGATGIIPYHGRLMDAKYFQAIDRAMMEIAAVEDFYFDGKACHDRITVQRDDDGESLYAQVGQPLLGKDWRKSVAWRAHELDGQVLLTLFNFDHDHAAGIKVDMDGASFTLSDPVRRRPATDEPVQAADLKFFIPPNDVRLHVLRPVGEDH